jgi:membrane-associated phospholipid phosphatase
MRRAMHYARGSSFLEADMTRRENVNVRARVQAAMPHLPATSFETFASFDAAAAAWLRSHASPVLTHFMAAVSLAHSQLVLYAVGLALALYAWKRGEPRWSALAIIVIPAGLALNDLLKLAFARVRPSIGGVPSVYDTYSFPSGHSAGATFVYGFLAAYIAFHSPVTAVRAAAIVAATVMVALVAVSRLVLGVHFASDVTAGVAWAASWTAAWVWGLAPRRRRTELAQ